MGKGKKGKKEKRKREERKDKINESNWSKEEIRRKGKKMIEKEKINYQYIKIMLLNRKTTIDILTI